MRILHIVPSYYPAFKMGGPIESVHNLNKALIKAGADVTVYTTNIGLGDDQKILFGKEINLDGVKVFYFPVSFRPWQYSRQMHRALANNLNNFDLIHITSVFLSASTLGAYYARKFQKPYIISPRGSLMKEPLRMKSPLKKKIYLSLIEKRNLMSAAAIHFTVEKEREEYMAAKLPFKKAIIIPNSIDIPKLNSEILNFRGKFNIAPDKKIILFLSRLNWKKGLDTLIPAFAEVVKKEPNVILVLAGPDEANYKKEVELKIANCKLKIDNDVIFTGMLVGDEKFAALHESDVFVLPSYSENFGMSVVEAMACKIPVVITENVGISQEVSANEAGLVVKKNVSELFSAILKILQNPELAEKISQSGYELAKEKFAIDKVAKKFLLEYNKLIK